MQQRCVCGVRTASYNDQSSRFSASRPNNREHSFIQYPAITGEASSAKKKFGEKKSINIHPGCVFFSSGPAVPDTLTSPGQQIHGYNPRGALMLRCVWSKKAASSRAGLLFSFYLFNTLIFAFSRAQGTPAASIHLSRWQGWPLSPRVRSAMAASSLSIFFFFFFFFSRWYRI